MRENLLTFAGYHGIPRKIAAGQAAELLDFVQLTERANAKVDELSGGMQRRVLIARALVHDPELVVLDEPTTGLDPQTRQLVWERLRGLRRLGKTLLLTTHYMEEAAQLCDQVTIIHGGRAIADGSPRELVERHVAPEVIEVIGAPGGLAAIRRATSGLPCESEEVGDRVLLYVHGSQQILSRLSDGALGRASLLRRDATLEDVFLRLTGRGLGTD